MLKRTFDYSSRFRILKGGKISLVVSALLGSVVIASAAPSGGTVTSGIANISQSGNVTNINQSTQKASINWNNFSIASNETVNFNQSNVNSVTLNRVIGNEKSIIDGALNANGQVWILNSNGILFNKSAKINTAGLLATTAQLSDKDFQDGNYNFKNSSKNSVINLGTIEVANSGYVVLSSNEVKNPGTIKAVKGKVHLVGADSYSLNLNGNSIVNLVVDKGILDSLVENSGTIIADGGEVYLTTNAVNELLKGVVNNTGIIEANSLDGLTGKVTIMGEEINLKSGSKISATGTNGGGEVLVGGDWQGSGNLKQATKVTMESGSTIDSSATQSGDGGKVVIWSDVKNADSVTEVHGTILAKGGSQSGNGGKIETSGHLLIIDGVTGSAAANKGEAGTWLFDPTNVIIGSSGSTASGSNDGTSTLTASSIAGLLNGGTSVMITTSSTGTDLGDLTVNSAITKSSGNTDVALTLRAANSIVINSDITNTGGSGKLNLIFDADNNANVATSTPSRDGGGIVILGSNLSTGGGSLTFGGTTSSGFTGGDLYIGGGSNAISLTTSGGALDVKGQLIIATSNASGVTLSTSGGNITLGGSVDSGNTYTAVSGTWTWDQAKNDADNVVNSYLATITTRLENALAIRAAGYNAAWLGGQRISGTNLWEWVTDPAYNSSTNKMVFFYQGTSTQTELGGTSSGAGGTTATGYFANWSGWTNEVALGEPNNWNGSVPGTFANTYESALQFTGNLGQWNDLSTSYNLNQYVRETNLSPSKLTLNAGSGSVTINGAVGASKALSSLDITSSSTQVNGSAIITTGAQNYSSNLTVNSSSSNPMPDVTLQGTGLTAHGPITVYGGSNIYLNSNITTTDDLWLSATSINAGGSERTVQAGSGDVRITANSVANGGITITSTTGAFIYEPKLTNWDYIGGTLNVTGTLSSNNYTGGSDVAWLKIQGVSGLTGLQFGKVGNTSGVWLQTPWTINGAINIYGSSIIIGENLDTRSAGTSGDILLKATDNITLEASKSIVTNAGDITFWADSDATGGGYIYINDNVMLDSRSTADRSANKTSTATGGGVITLGGGSASATLVSGTIVPTGYALNSTDTALLGGINFGTHSITSHNANIALYSGGGDITVKGKSTVTSNTESNGILSYEGLTMDSGVEGNIILDGEGGVSGASYSGGIYFGYRGTNNAAATLLRTNNGNISLKGTGSGAINNRGLILNGGTTQQITLESTGAGTILLNGNGSTQDNVLWSSNILATSGDIDIIGSGAGPLMTEIALTTIGSKVGSHVTSSSSNINISDNSFSITSGKGLALNTTGKVLLQPYGDDFNSALTTANISFSTGITGLTIGKSTISADGTTDAGVTIANAITIAGPISIYSGDITINAKLEATGTNTITLDGSGTVSNGASGYVVTSNLLLLDGAVILDNTLNNVDTLSASGISSLDYIDADALTIGTVGATNGITATSTTSVATKTDDLTVSQNISATSVILNAGKDTAAGTSTGGNIIINGTPTITATTGNAKLYTGSISGSTEVDSLISAGNFRYNSDESSTGFTTALGTTGIYAIYREQPSASGTISDETITYGDTEPSFTGVTGTVNGDDTSGYSIVSAAYSTASKLKAGSYTVDASGLTALGYDASAITNGTLKVDKADLTISGITVSNKTYDAATTATLGGTAAITPIISDVVTLGGTAAGIFADKNVGTGKTITITGNTISGADAANYNLVQQTGLSADITKASLTVTADDRTKVYGDSLTLGTSAFTSSGLQGGETIGSVTLDSANSYATSTTQDVNTYLDEIIVSSAIGGTFDIGNYDVTYAVGDLAITQKALGISYTGTNKTYDGTTNATVSESITGVINSDTVTVSEIAAFDNKDVGSSRNISISGITLSGADTGNYSLTTTSSTTADITKANLTVTANDDAKFVTQVDSAGFAGVSYNGFVNGETSTVLGGAIAIARTNAGTDVAGIYTDVLQSSGLNSSNYNITYANGDFTIVPSDQLLVRLSNVNDTYGTDTQYTISSVEYENSGTVYRLDNNSIANSTTSIDVNNEVRVTDGSSATAIFTVAPQSSSTSTAGKLEVGSYQLGVEGLVTENSANFSDTVTIVGAHQVNQKSITVSATGVSKVYDATTSMSGVSLGLSTLETSDVVTVDGTGAFSDKNVGTALNYTLNNLTLSGTDATNYYLSVGTSFSGNDGIITKKDITVSYTADNKVYDGSTTATVTDSTSDIIGGDTVTISENAVFADKNVGTNKTVSVSTISLGGVDATNYNLTSTTATTTADITRLNSVTWIGGTTGNWFDPANWAGGAVPDLSNVANVVISTGVVVSFDTSGVVSPADASSAVNIDSLGTLGSLTMANGALNVQNGMTLDTFTQNGGTLTAGTIIVDTFAQTNGTITTTGNFIVNDEFSQGTTGSVSVGGNTNITDTTGGVVLGNLNTTGTTNIASTNGDITQANNTAMNLSGTTTLNAGINDITLNNANNDFQGTVNASGKDLTLTDGINGIQLGNIRANKNLIVNSLNGNITQTLNTNLVIGENSTFNAGNHDINLGNLDNEFSGKINLSGNSAIIGAKKRPVWGAINTNIYPKYVSSVDDNILKVIDAISNKTAINIKPPKFDVKVNTSNQGNINFVNNNSVNVASQPMAGSGNKLVTMSELKETKTEENDAGNVNQDFMVPLGDDSIIQLVNAGVNLPEGVEQLFFVSTNENQEN